MVITGSDIAAIITATGVLITICQNALTYLESRRNGKKADAIGEQVKVIKEQTDGINDKLIAKTDEAARAQGTLVGIEKTEQKNAAAHPNDEPAQPPPS